MNRDIILGKNAEGETVTVQIRVEDIDRDLMSVNHEVVPAGSTKRLSITGTVWQKGNHWRDGDIVSAGQCDGALLEIVEPTAPWTLGEIAELHALWKRWHLNDMRAGCVHQTKIVYENDNYGGRRVALNETTAANDCPMKYRYGSAWLCEPLPADVIERVQTFQRRLKP